MNISQLDQRTVHVAFHHELGDCVYFAHLIPLYTRRGYSISVDCAADKEILFRAAGAIVSANGSSARHPWSSPTAGTHIGHGRFWQGSRMGHNISEAPLPNIGCGRQLFEEYCLSRIKTLFVA